MSFEKVHQAGVRITVIDAPGRRRVSATRDY